MVSFSRRVLLLLSLIITIGLFIGGFFVGMLFDSSRTNDLDALLLKTQMDTESFVTERQFFDTFGSTDCNVLNERVIELGTRLGEIGNALARYDAKKMSKGELYNQLRRRYFLLGINAYSLRKQVFNYCNAPNTNTVLFFYNIENNQEALNQGYALDSIVNKRKNLVVISIDVGFEDSAIKSLAKYYGITKAPAIVLNFDKVFERFVSEGELIGLMRENPNGAEN